MCIADKRMYTHPLVTAMPSKLEFSPLYKPKIPSRLRMSRTASYVVCSPEWVRRHSSIQKVSESGSGPGLELGRTFCSLFVSTAARVDRKMSGLCTRAHFPRSTPSGPWPEHEGSTH